MLLHCNAIKKYSVRFEDNVVYVSEVCLNSGYLILQWLAHRVRTRWRVFPHGSTPSHLWSSLAKKSSPDLVRLPHLTTTHTRPWLLGEGSQGCSHWLLPLREGRDTPEPFLGRVTRCVGSKIHPVQLRRQNGSTLAIENPKWDAMWERKWTSLESFRERARTRKISAQYRYERSHSQRGLWKRITIHSQD